MSDALDAFRRWMDEAPSKRLTAKGPVARMILGLADIEHMAGFREHRKTEPVPPQSHPMVWRAWQDWDALCRRTDAEYWPTRDAAAAEEDG